MSEPLRSPRQPPFWLAWAALAGAVGFAVAQPVYDVLRDSPAFFVAHQADGWDLLGLSVVLSLLLPLALALLVAVARAVHPTAGRTLLAASLGACAALFGLAIVRRYDGSTALALAAAVALAAPVAGSVVRPRLLRAVALLAVGTVVFPALFLGSPEMRALLEDEAAEEAEAEASAGRLAGMPVVLIVFDEFPTVSLMTAERLVDAGRYPAFARLAATSTWYREATTVAQSTAYSVPSILTGRYPAAGRKRAPAYRDYRKNLFTLLDRQVPRNVWETSTRLCPRRLCRQPKQWTIGRRERLPAMLRDVTAIYLHQVTPPRWRDHLPAIDDRWRDFWDPASGPGIERPGRGKDRADRPDALFAWFLNGLERHGRLPALHFAHVMLPHQPWNWLPDGRRYPTLRRQPHGLGNQFWVGSEWEVTEAHRRHLLTVGTVDRLVGDLLDTLERTGALDDALLIVTADHGGAFEQGASRRNLRRRSTSEIVRVPLFVKLPGQRAGRIDDRNAETIDILPTILELIRVEASPPPDGVSLLAPPQVKGELKHAYPTGNVRSPASGGPITFPLGDDLGREEALARLLDRFGSGSWEAVFDAGTRPELHGVEVASLELDGETDPLTASVFDLERWEAVDPRADLLPLHVFGDLETLDKRRRTLAVALNGTIRCTTESFVDDYVGPAFTALLPPGALEEGTNRLEVFEIGDGAAGPRPLRLVAARPQGAEGDPP